jgi:hypothetical protein
MENNRGQFGLGLVLGIFFLVIVIVAFISVLPMISEMIDVGTGYDAGLNCKSTTYWNSTAMINGVAGGERSAIGCLGLKMFIPLVVLVVLVAAIGMILASGNRQPSQLPTYG